MSTEIMRMHAMFRNRLHAGKVLGEIVGEHLAAEPEHIRDNVLVVGIPFGGVPVADGVAEALGSALTIVHSGTIHSPTNARIPIAIASSDGTMAWSDELHHPLGEQVHLYVAAESKRVAKSAKEVEVRMLHRAGIDARLSSKDKCVIVVADGVNSGMKVIAVGRTLRNEGVQTLVLATPVTSMDKRERLFAEFDLIICPVLPREVHAIEDYYMDFQQVQEKEVVDVLRRRAGRTLHSLA